MSLFVDHNVYPFLEGEAAFDASWREVSDKVQTLEESGAVSLLEAMCDEIRVSGKKAAFTYEVHMPWSKRGERRAREQKIILGARFKELSEGNPYCGVALAYNPAGYTDLETGYFVWTYDQIEVAPTIDGSLDIAQNTVFVVDTLVDRVENFCVRIGAKVLRSQAVKAVVDNAYQRCPAV